MIEDTHHLWEAMDLADVEELKDLHLKTEGGVDHEYHLEVPQHQKTIRANVTNEAERKH